MQRSRWTGRRPRASHVASAPPCQPVPIWQLSSARKAMGGNAFKSALPNAAFPRLKPQIYHQLKEQLTSRLRTVYALVAVPHEAPGKEDFGDIDFVVCQPVDGLDMDTIRSALGAQHVIDLVKVYNLAVPLQDENCFCQLDIHVCADPDDWHRTLFSLSYGDMYMILGLMARGSGLAFSRHGLKVCRSILVYAITNSYINLYSSRSHCRLHQKLHLCCAHPYHAS